MEEIAEEPIALLERVTAPDVKNTPGRPTPTN